MDLARNGALRIYSGLTSLLGYFALDLTFLLDHLYRGSGAPTQFLNLGLWPVAAAANYPEAALALAERVIDGATSRIHDASSPGWNFVAPAPTSNLALDAGCGCGDTSLLLSQHFSRVVAINNNARQCQIARMRGVDAVCGDACNMPCESGSAAAVVAVDAAYHFERRAFVRESARALAPGGVYSVSDVVGRPGAGGWGRRWRLWTLTLGCWLLLVTPFCSYTTSGRAAPIRADGEPGDVAGRVPARPGDQWFRAC